MPDGCQTRTDAVPAPVPWKRQPGESSKAHAAFCAYVQLGPDRSLTKLAKLLGRGEGASWLKEWSGRHRWVLRAAAWDDEQRQAALDELAMGKTLRGISNYLFKLGVDGLEATERTPEQSLKLLDEGVKFDRHATRKLAQGAASI